MVSTPWEGLETAIFSSNGSDGIKLIDARGTHSGYGRKLRQVTAGWHLVNAESDASGSLGTLLRSNNISPNSVRQSIIL